MRAGVSLSRMATASSAAVFGDSALVEGSILFTPIVPSLSVTRMTRHLVIFLDCGSNSHDSIKYLNDKKIDTIVLDHHNIEPPYPLSNVIINPKKKLL